MLNSHFHQVSFTQVHSPPTHPLLTPVQEEGGCIMAGTGRNTYGVHESTIFTSQPGFIIWIQQALRSESQIYPDPKTISDASGFLLIFEVGLDDF